MFIEVDTIQLGRDESDLDAQIWEMQNVLDDVYEQMNELDAMWDGLASEVFKVQFARDKEYFTEACGEVQLLSESIAKARMEYEKCDELVSMAIDAIRI